MANFNCFTKIYTKMAKKVKNAEEKKLNPIQVIIPEWIKWNETTNIIHEILTRTANIVGEFAEQLVLDYLKQSNENYTMAKTSEKAYDIKLLDDQNKIQVKARKIAYKRNSNNQRSKEKNIDGQTLSDIHSWNFNTLIIVLFDEDGYLWQVRQITRDKIHPNSLKEAKNSSDKYYARMRNNGKAWVISLTQDFLEQTDDLTEEFKMKYPSLFNTIA